MIPVARQPEPDDFDSQVRQKGRKWLEGRGLPTSGARPPGLELEPYWHHCLPLLHHVYGGVCAYVCVFIEPVTGFATVEHFVPKSLALEHVYEWSNYRLACGKMNGRKSVFTNVLDPFELRAETFFLELVTGRMYPNPALQADDKRRAQETIDLLGLDDPECRKQRNDWLESYRKQDISLNFLRQKSPFVHAELIRQEGLLPATYSVA